MQQRFRAPKQTQFPMNIKQKGNGKSRRAKYISHPALAQFPFNTCLISVGSSAQGSVLFTGLLKAWRTHHEAITVSEKAVENKKENMKSASAHAVTLFGRGVTISGLCQSDSPLLLLNQTQLSGGVGVSDGLLWKDKCLAS